MGFWGRVLNTKAYKRDIADELKKIIDGTDNVSATGINITPDTALSYNPWYAGVSLIADSIAMLPLPFYKDDNKGDRARAYIPTSALFNRSANSYQSAFEFRHFMQYCATHYGNAYAVIERDSQLNPIALWPVSPEAVKGASLEKFQGQSILVYSIEMEEGQEPKKFPAYDIFHLKGLSTDGIFGVNPVDLFKDTLGLGVATERFGATVFDNNAVPGGTLEIPGIVSEDDKKNILRGWHNTYGGISNSNKIALLQGGAKFQAISQTNDNAQYLQTRAFSILDVCRMLRLKPHMLGDLSKSSYSSIEAQGIDYVTYTLLPWIKRWENEISRKLLSTQDKANRIYAEHNVDALLRGDTNSRYTAYAIGIQWGILTRNEVRQKENLPAIDGGNTIQLPLNMGNPGGNPDTTPQTQPQAQQKSYLLPLVRDICGRIDRRVSKAKDPNSERSYVLEAIRPIAEATNRTEADATALADKYLSTPQEIFGLIGEWVTNLG